MAKYFFTLLPIDLLPEISVYASSMKASFYGRLQSALFQLKINTHCTMIEMKKLLPNCRSSEIESHFHLRAAVAKFMLFLTVTVTFLVGTIDKMNILH